METIHEGVRNFCKRALKPMVISQWDSPEPPHKSASPCGWTWGLAHIALWDSLTPFGHCGVQ